MLPEMEKSTFFLLLFHISSLTRVYPMFLFFVSFFFFVQLAWYDIITKNHFEQLANIYQQTDKQAIHYQALSRLQSFCSSNQNVLLTYSITVNRTHFGEWGLVISCLFRDEITVLLSYIHAHNHKSTEDDNVSIPFLVNVKVNFRTATQ
jgi:hypothetical protein